MKFGIRLKLAGAFSLLILPLFLILSFGSYSITTLSKSTEAISKEMEELNLVNQLTVSLTSIMIPAYQYLETGNNDAKDSFELATVESGVNLEKIGKSSFESREEKEIYDAVWHNFSKFQTISSDFFKGRKVGKNQEASNRLREMTVLNEDMITLMQSYHQIVTLKVVEGRDTARQLRERVLYVFGVGGVGSLLFGLFVLFVFSRYFGRSISSLADAAGKIGGGNLELNLPVRSGDELGDLAAAFNKMAADLKQAALERKRMEEQLLQSQRLESVGRLAGGVAHDFNNILTTVVGYCELLLDKTGKDDPFREKLEQIKKSGDRATALTRQLLAFSRKQVLQPETLNLSVVIVDMEDMLTRLIGEDIILSVKLTNKAAMVQADRTQIEQVVVNLAVNARDAMPKGGQLILETANVTLDEIYTQQRSIVKPGQYVCMAISDTGIGMDRETQAHIFEPFFSTKEKYKGTGLGLATVYGIVAQSNGYIWVYSEPHKGTTFKIYLPRIDMPATNETAPKETIRPSGGSETILLVEDEDSVRSLAEEVLTSNGYRVLAASNPAEALKLLQDLKQPSIHLLLTDVIMPVMSGRDLAKQVSAQYPQIKVLYMSGYTDDAIGHHGVLDPGVAFLQKPFAHDALLCKVRDVLDNRTL